MSRLDTRASAPKRKFGIPGFQRPNPNPSDQLIEQHGTIRKELYKPLAIGTPHPSYPNALLVKQSIESEDGTEYGFVRFYTSIPEAQQVYSRIIQYLEEDNANPVFIHSLVIPQTEYTAFGYPQTKKTPCSAVVGLKITDGGSDYNGDTDTITIADPVSGVTATGVIQAVNGVIVAVNLTNGGSGYTAAPAVTINTSTGNSGAITAVLQPQTALLVSEKTEGMQDETLAPVYFRIIQVYKTLPGPTIDTLTYTEAGEKLTIAKYEDFVSSHASAPSLSLNVLKASFTASDSVVGDVETQTRDAPAILNARLFNHELAFGARTTEQSTEIAPGGGSDLLVGISASGATLDQRIEPISEYRSKIVTITLGDGTNNDTQPYVYDWTVDPETEIPTLTIQHWVNGPGVQSPDVSATPSVYGGHQVVISSISNANPAVVTTAVDHIYSNNDVVFIWGTAGEALFVASSPPTTEASNVELDGFFVATILTPTTFSIPLDLSALSGPVSTDGLATATKASTGSWLAQKYALMTTGDGAGTVDILHDTLDYKLFDKWRTLQIRRKMPALYNGVRRRRYSTSFYHFWPNVLCYAYFNWAFASTSNAEEFQTGLVINFAQGFRGYGNAYVDEIITLDPKLLLVPQIAKWNPQSFDIVANWGIALSSGQTTARAVTFRIPDVVVPRSLQGVVSGHTFSFTTEDPDGYSFSSAGSPGYPYSFSADGYFYPVGYLTAFGDTDYPSVGAATQYLPCTDEYPPLPNTYYPLDVMTPQPWRDGAWITRVTYGSFPALFSPP